MLSLTLLVAATTPMIHYIGGPTGFQTGFPAVHRALSSTPGQDQSTGEAMLRYSHRAAFHAPRYPVVRFAPDGKTFIALTAERQLQYIDVASGASLGAIGEPLALYESYDIDWSLDGRFLVLRTNGEAVKTVGTTAPRYRNRYRIYTLADLHLVGELAYQEERCLASSETPVMFAADGQSFWALCSQANDPLTANSLMALQIEVPAMTVRDVRRYGESLAHGAVQSLARTDGEVVTWQLQRSPGEALHFQNLTLGQNLAAIPDLTQPTLGGKLTFQRVWLDRGKIAALLCGGSSEVSDPAQVDKPGAAVHSFCRTLFFNLHTGVLISKTDEANRPWGATQSDIQDPLRHLHIRTAWHDGDKAGEVTVSDATTGRERQHLDTQAQRALTFSPDGRWLVMQSIGQNGLRLYQVSP